MSLKEPGGRGEGWLVRAVSEFAARCVERPQPRGILATLSLFALLAGCAQAIDRAPLETTVGAVPVRERNYELGRFQESYVGAPMIRVRDYVATKVLENVARASHDFTVSGGFIEISGRVGDLYPIVGKTDYDGRDLTVVSINSFGIMIDGAGKPIQKVINMQGGNQIVMVYTFTVEPPEVTFARVSRDRVDTSNHS